MPATYDFSLNRNEIIKAALQKLGVLEAGGTPSSDQYTDGATAFNSLIKHLQTKGLPLWSIKTKVVTFTASQASYNSTTHLSIERPLKVTNIILTRTSDSTIIPPLLQMSREEYLSLGKPSATGIPTSFYVNYNQATIDIIFYPTPSTSVASDYTATMYYQRPFADFDSSTDVPDFPQEWTLCLIYQLAVTIAPDYGITGTTHYSKLEEKANELLEDLLSFNTDGISISFVPDIHNGYRY